MKDYVQPVIVSPQSPLYRALRWAYQPVKAMQRAVAWRRWRPRTQRIIAEYLAHTGFKGLHVGCGPFRLDGWLNTDLLGHDFRADLPLDITRPLPLPDNSLDALYASEVIEHLSRDKAIAFLREGRRVLREGGVLRLTTPDLDEVCRLYLGQRGDVDLDRFGEFWLEGEFSREIWINAQFRAHGHQHLWSFAELSEALGRAGFDKIVRCPPLHTLSPIAQLAGLETRYGPDAPPWLFARTLIVEAERQRPALSMPPPRRIASVALEQSAAAP